VNNLRHALRAPGLLYLTLEVLRDQAATLAAAYADAIVKGLPALPGEEFGTDSGGYHFYPSDVQVSTWLEAARLVVVEDATDMSYGEWGYRHLLLQKRP
jgi:hypothetical protein